VAGEPAPFATQNAVASYIFAVPGDPADPDGFSAVAGEWTEWLGSHGYSHMTMVHHSYWLATFAAWAELRGVDRPADVTLACPGGLPAPREPAPQA
jgi:hypothetical protein